MRSSSCGAAAPALWLLLLAGGFAEAARDQQTAAAAGIAAYQENRYREAAKSFKEALRQAPDDSSLHHWLGKSYGRIAENGNWLQAMSYSKKTLRQFRRAVELDGANRDALRDLADYLEKAPRFLGGDKKEADALLRRLAAMQDAGEDGAAGENGDE